MVKNQINHQESVKSNLPNHTSNPGPLLQKPSLWFQLSWGDLIIIPLIMVMWSFTLQSFQFNLTLNMFHIQTPLPLNQLMMMKCTISRNSSTQNMMKIFCMLKSICCRLHWWYSLLQNSLHYLMYCFIKMEERMLQSQISFHTFPYLYKPRPL